MSNYAISLKRSSLLLAALTFTALLLVVNFASFFSTADAAQFSNRSLTLSSTLVGTEVGDGTPGEPENGSEATHTFNFTLPSTTSIQSVLLRYCTDPISDTCTAPTGLNLASATVDAAASSFTTEVLGTVTANTAEIGFAAYTTGGAVTVELDNVVNPTAVGTFFVRMTTHSDNNPDEAGFTDQVDEGSVASAITEGIEITARVKETLGFSTTGAFAGTAAGSGVDNPTSACSPLTGSGAITLGDPTENALTLTTTFFNYSAFRTYTNAANGVTITYEGDTLEKGTDNIDEIGGAEVAVNTPGTSEQFGLAVDGGIGTNATATVNSVSGTRDFTYVNQAAAFSGDPGELTIDADYDNGAGDVTTATPTFAFLSKTTAAGVAQELATSASYVNCVTVPVRYVANIEPLTAAGVYTTTIVYTAVPEY